ncbi:hypothetical protein, conserved [Eimeria tenella]|uniref:Uncharacterized protein n=1 Tax=Eimeria tenella TaxID=5802 RepID=U6KYM0_EIMTE|nr:hypothetical protein, conserved [Eimeria tenella]CDJ42018.1 hypothetical protein, conserved [Eimeria tenella]|eukprot:XP_013232768.1 hypothetical protein, conserved [Eimeria tenella]
MPARRTELSEPQGIDLSTSGEQTEDSQHQSTEEQELATLSESNGTKEMSSVPPPSTSEEPVAHSHASESVEKTQLSHTVRAPLAATTSEEHASSIQPRGSGTQGKGVAKPLEKPDRHGTGGSSKAPLEENKSNASSSAPKSLPHRIKFGSARNRSPTEHESGDKPELRRVASDDYRARRQALPRRKEGSLYSHRLLWNPEQSPASTGSLRKGDDS